MRALTAAPERILFWALVALLVWLPIPLGSNRAWAWGIMEAAAFALMAAWLLAWAFGRVRVTPAISRAWIAWSIFGCWIAWLLLQTLPLPAEIVQRLSPEAFHMHALVRDIGAPEAWMTLSIEPHATRVFLLKSLAYGALFFLVLALANQRWRCAMLARVLVYAAVMIAVYAVVMHLGGMDHHYFGARIRHVDSASGTFVNRNHFAGYLELMLALGIGLLIADLSDRSSDSWKRFLRNLLEWILSPKMVLRLALCILVIAITTTHSRSGNTAFFASLLVAGAIGITLSRLATRNTVILLASLIAIDLFIVGSWFGVEKLAKRIQETAVQDVEEREEPALAATGLLSDYPIFGSGGGTFYIAFPRYRQQPSAVFFDHAHNDYAEMATDTGVVGFALIGSFVAASLGAALLAQWRRRDPLMRGMSFACIMGVTALLIHSWTDFNLQIPANAAYFMVLLALGWISLHLDRRDDDSGIQHRTRHPDSE